jgi:hypothetical protein
MTLVDDLDDDWGCFSGIIVQQCLWNLQLPFLDSDECSIIIVLAVRRSVRLKLFTYILHNIYVFISTGISRSIVYIPMWQLLWQLLSFGR